MAPDLIYRASFFTIFKDYYSFFNGFHQIFKNWQILSLLYKKGAAKATAPSVWLEVHRKKRGNANR